MNRLLFFFSCVLLLPGCELVSPNEDPADIRPLTSSEIRIVEADNRFGLNLFRAVSEEDVQANVLVSPLSVSMALGMTLNGAHGATYDAMVDALEKKGLSEDDINTSYRRLIDMLQTLDPKVVFEIANSIWVREGFPVEEQFLDVNRQFFDAKASELDFAGSDAVATINGWVDEKTHGKIDKIIESIGPQVVMYLINAIYFNGTWMIEFDEDNTVDRPFTNYDGSLSDVPMMGLEADLPFVGNDQFQAVDLPYGDSLFSMTVVAPHEGVDINALIAELDDTSWHEHTRHLSTKEVHLQMPRFKLDYDIKLKSVLSALGMEPAFDPNRADFTRIHANGGLYISEVIHKTHIEVDEKGTEAAAVTAVEIELTSATGEYMRVERPFLYVIRERHTGTILFIGKVLNL